MFLKEFWVKSFLQPAEIIIFVCVINLILYYPLDGTGKLESFKINMCVDSFFP